MKFKFRWFAGFASVASITSSLTAMVEDLKAHAEAMLTKRDFHMSESDTHTRLADEAAAERIKAEAVAEKISGLMN